MSRPFIAVELASPATNREPGEAAGGGRNGYDLGGPSPYARYLGEVRRLAAAGAGAITVADNPLASPRADSALLAAAVARDTGVPVIPHLACRDRNRNALLSALLALDLLGVREILAVTGDPVRSEDRDAIRNLATFDSAGLARLVAGWNGERFSRPFSVSAALNVNAPNFPAELGRAGRKIRSGVSRFFTQPILCDEALRNLETAKGELGAEILAGVLPVVSAKNARFLEEKVKGIRVDPGLARRFEGLDREGATRVAAETSVDVARAALGVADGLYLITPFRRVDIVVEIIAAVTEPSRADWAFADAGADRPGLAGPAELADRPGLAGSAGRQASLYSPAKAPVYSLP